MRNPLLPALGLVMLLTSGIPSIAQSKNKSQTNPAEKFKDEAIADLQIQRQHYKDIALSIWGYAELGFNETKSSGLHQKTLTDAGFTLQTGVAGMPTAFVATYGSGQPVIGILAEFDALPGLSQDSVPEKKPIGGLAGHACGHHLFGTASVATAIELKKIMETHHLPGTLKVFGTPAEEGGAGKVYMVRDGLFNGIDVVLHWHPATDNGVAYSNSLAVISAKFRFHGLAAHAAMAPDKGRSALDGVESMDYMANMMREHIPSDARIHYVITDGGKAPNVVPDFSEVYYFVRNKNREIAKSIFDRLVKCAEGAALGTGTTMDYEIIDGDYDILPNRILSVAMQKDLVKVGGVTYTPEEIEFAKKIQATFAYKAPPITSAGDVQPLPATPLDGPASSDVGDVSWNVPTIGLGAATWVPGTPAHSWQAVACGGTDIGIKGMMVAAKTLTCMGIDLLTQPKLIQDAKTEFQQDRGPNFNYIPLLGNRKPALNYRH